jgi:hypothetical protein
MLTMGLGEENPGTGQVRTEVENSVYVVIVQSLGFPFLVLTWRDGIGGTVDVASDVT